MQNQKKTRLENREREKKGEKGAESIDVEVDRDGKEIQENSGLQ